MKPVPFTQYLRPSGNTDKVVVDRPDNVAEKAARIIAAGYRLECEMLQSNLIMVSISNGEEDLAAELAPNGPGLMAKIDEMIMGFDPETGRQTGDEAYKGYNL